MAAGVTANFGPFCSKDFYSGVSSLWDRLITHLFWTLEVVEVAVVLKVWVVLGTRGLGFLIWVFLYCRKVFSLLLKMVFCRFMKVVLTSVCCGDILLSSYFSLEVVGLNIGTLDSIVDRSTFSFPYYGLFKMTSYPFDLQGFWCYFIGYSSEVKNSCSSRFGKLHF